MVEDEAVASAGPSAGGPSRGGEILKSNVEPARAVDEAPGSTSRAASRSILPLVLAGVLLFVLGAGAALFWSSTQPRAQTRPSTPVAAAATTTTSAGAQPAVNGISCDALEATIEHVHVHLAIFVNGQEQQIPYGVGIAQPWQVSNSDEGPFVTDGACFYWLHTHTEDGILHIESPIRRRFSLGDFFAIWQMPLSENEVGPTQGPVITYVNGQKSSTAPQDITLLPHERIQLDVGVDVPPYPFDFPDSD